MSRMAWKPCARAHEGARAGRAGAGLLFTQRKAASMRRSYGSTKVVRCWPSVECRVWGPTRAESCAHAHSHSPGGTMMITAADSLGLGPGARARARATPAWRHQRPREGDIWRWSSHWPAVRAATMAAMSAATGACACACHGESHGAAATHPGTRQPPASPCRRRDAACRPAPDHDPHMIKHTPPPRSHRLTRKPHCRTKRDRTAQQRLRMRARRHGADTPCQLVTQCGWCARWGRRQIAAASGPSPARLHCAHMRTAAPTSRSRTPSCVRRRCCGRAGSQGLLFIAVCTCARAVVQWCELHAMHELRGRRGRPRQQQ